MIMRTRSIQSLLSTTSKVSFSFLKFDDFLLNFFVFLSEEKSKDFNEEKSDDGKPPKNSFKEQESTSSESTSSPSPSLSSGEIV